MKKLNPSEISVAAVARSATGRIPVFLINLVEDSQKFKAVQSQLDTRFFEIFPVRGVSGHTIPDAVCLKLTRDPNSLSNKGALGCMLSHFRTWELVARTKADFAVILEDDVDCSLLHNISNLHLPPNFDIIFCNDRMASRNKLSGLLSLRNVALAHDLIDEVDQQGLSVGGDGYILTPRGAARLLEAFTKDLFFGHVDVRLLAYSILNLNNSQPSNQKKLRLELWSIRQIVGSDTVLDAFSLSPPLVKHTGLESRRVREDSMGRTEPFDTSKAFRLEACRQVVTFFGTLVYYDEVLAAFLHGDITQVPRNVFLHDDDEESYTLLIYKNGIFTPFQTQITSVTTPRDPYIGLSAGNVFFCADDRGVFSLTRRVMSDWETFYIIDAQALRDVDCLLSNDWVTITDRKSIGRKSATLQKHFEIEFNGFSYPLEKVVEATAVGRVNNEAGKLVNFILSKDWTYEIFELFDPVIYYTAFGQEHIFIMLVLSIQSVERFGNFSGKYLIISDKCSDALKNMFPSEMHARICVINVEVDKNLGYLASRYQIQDISELFGHRPIIYLDVDIICTSPISELLTQALLSKKILVGSETDERPLSLLDENMGNWFGTFLFIESGKTNLSRFNSINSGVIAAPDFHVLAKAFELILAVSRQFLQKHPDRLRPGNAQPLEKYHDQPFASFVLQTYEFVDGVALNTFVQNVWLGEPAYDRVRCLVHFNQGVGDGKKVQRMLDHMAKLSSRELLAGP